MRAIGALREERQENIGRWMMKVGRGMRAGGGRWLGQGVGAGDSRLT